MTYGSLITLKQRRAEYFQGFRTGFDSPDLRFSDCRLLYRSVQATAVRCWLSTEATVTGSFVVAYVKWNWCLSRCHILVSCSCEFRVLCSAFLC